MKVLYDSQIFSVQKIGGISRYFYEIAKRNSESKISFLYTENFYLESKNSIKDFKGKNRIINFVNKLKNIMDLYSGKFEIFHPTYYDPYFFRYSKVPFVVTVYDMIHEIYRGKYFKNSDPTLENKKKLCLAADGIIAISQKTKEDLIEILNINPEKIKVIHLGSNLKKEIKNVLLPQKYILFVGSRWGYKNFDKFFEATSELLKEDEKLSLVCVGNKFSSDEQNLIKESKVQEKVFQILAKDDEMYTIYKNAECFVFPSLYEGFGIPILEAFESDCPVILSDASCFPEIAGKAGEYFNPKSVESIRSAIKNVIYNKERKIELLVNSKNQLKKFSWDKTAKETEEFYRDIIEKGNKKNGL